MEKQENIPWRLHDAFIPLIENYHHVYCLDCNHNSFFVCVQVSNMMLSSTVEPLYNKVLGTMKITLLYQGEKKNIKSWDQQNYLVIRGFCYIRPLYNEISLYFRMYVVHLYRDGVNFYPIYIQH